ncbi:ATPase inhibitor, mitochondrial-like [Prorops nasuta]|uniref:ATPase inhibitor, mitochondrial-like n=1 Tax=Prorops nasuta TaxID=863751 RepID=UPI0034CE1D61
MLRRIVRELSQRNSCSTVIRNKHTLKENQFKRKDAAFEAAYYYKRDKQLLTALKQKTQDEIRTMQNEIRALRKKIIEHKRDIKETLRFLRELEEDLPSNDIK